MDAIDRKRRSAEPLPALTASFGEDVHTNAKGFLDQIAFYVQEWRPHHWLFYYFLIPAVLLSLTLLSTELQSQLVLNTAEPTFYAVFLMNFSHASMQHLSENVIIYLFSVTIIFFIEGKKNVFLYSSLVFLFVLPFLVSFATFLTIGSTEALLIQGFSGITSAFLGYAAYSVARSLYSNFLYLPFKKIRSYTIAGKGGVFLLVILLSVVIIFLMLFGLSLGIVTTQDGYLVFGPGHFIGYIVGFLTPMIIGLFFRRRYILLNLFLLLYIGITIMVYLPVVGGV